MTPTATTSAPTKTLVNDFCISIATENGSGSASANQILYRTFFRMGIPVSSKNLFPSNIQGLPTWYNIRLNKDGWLGRHDVVDIVLAMNPATFADDVKMGKPGALFIYDSSEPLPSIMRTDLTLIDLPTTSYSKSKEYAAQFKEPKLRKLLKNLIYVGVVTKLLGVDPKYVEEAVKDVFGAKPKVIESNLDVVRIGYALVDQHKWSLPGMKAEPMVRKDDTLLIEGNEALALGCVFGGMTFMSWYPITPSSSVAEGAMSWLEKLRSKGGENTFAVVQAEDELAAVGMIIGAGWAGARAMTTTSGPGISLMQEQIGLAYYAEIPCVIVDVQRVGPSTGLPTRTQQADIKICYYASHGDTKHPLFLPATPDEAFEFSWRSFDAAEQFQTPVFVLTDLDLGMNLWPSKPLRYPDANFTRGKLLDDEKLKQVKDFARYRDVDGDGIPYRTTPGVQSPHGVWFSRGTGHDEYAKYSEKPADYKKNVDRLARKFNGFRNNPLLPRPVVEGDAKARIGFIAFGTTHNPLQEARGRLAARGIASEYLRLRSLPFGKEVDEFIARHEYVYVVEQNRDGQLACIIRAERPALAAKVRRLNVYDGFPPAAADIVARFDEGEKAGLTP